MTDRKTLIQKSTPTVSRAFSPEAGAVADRFLELAEDLKALEPTERARLTAAMLNQLSSILTQSL